MCLSPYTLACHHRDLDCVVDGSLARTNTLLLSLIWYPETGARLFVVFFRFLSLFPFLAFPKPICCTLWVFFFFLSPLSNAKQNATVVCVVCAVRSVILRHQFHSICDYVQMHAHLTLFIQSFFRFCFHLTQRQTRMHIGTALTDVTWSLIWLVFFRRVSTRLCVAQW